MKPEKCLTVKGMERRSLAVYWEYYQAYHWARARAVLARADEHSFDVRLYALANGADDCHRSETAADLIDRTTLLVPDRVRSPGNDRRIRDAFVDCLDRTMPDVVVTPGYVGCVARSALGWCRNKQRGAVLMFETQERDQVRKFWKEWVKRRVVSRYDAGFAGGRTHREYLQKLGMTGDRVVTGYDSVDNAFFGRMADVVRTAEGVWRQRLGLPGHFFLAVGRMIPKKAFPFLVRAFGRFAKAERLLGRVPWDLVIIGDGPERPSIEAEIAALGGLARVILPGYLTTEHSSAYFGLASVFVMPSAFEEQWGLVVNEAMAAGLPVLACDICGSTPDLVLEGTTGFAFGAWDELKLAELMAWCASQPDKLPLLGAAARAHVENYSIDNFAVQLFRAADLAYAHASTRRKWQVL